MYYWSRQPRVFRHITSLLFNRLSKLFSPAAITHFLCILLQWYTCMSLYGNIMGLIPSCQSMLYITGTIVTWSWIWWNTTIVILSVLGKYLGAECKFSVHVLFCSSHDKSVTVCPITFISVDTMLLFNPLRLADAYMCQQTYHQWLR